MKAPLKATLIGLLAALAVLVTTLPGPATAALPEAGSVSMGGDLALRTPVGSNPLAGRTWGVYKGAGEPTWDPYVQATGTDKELLGKIALQPKARWFTANIPTDQIAGKVRAYITNSQAGDPEALVQMTIFRMVPWESEACKRLPTEAEKASYRAWIDQFASAVGTAHTAIILQPDGPFALCAPGGSREPSKLIRYSAQVLSALPNTSVYIDAGAWDWPYPNATQGGVDAAVKILVRAGVTYTRGFALNSTHYSSTAKEVKRGVGIINALNAKGITGKHFVVNTSSNGHPFVFGDYTGADDNNAMICSSWTVDPSKTCITLGIPPTADVTNPQWYLDATTSARAGQYVDGFLWFGRPWLYRQASPFVLSRALKLAAGSRW